MTEQSEISLQLPLSIEDCWDLIIDEEAQSHWVGAEGTIGSRPGSSCYMTHFGTGYSGVVASIDKYALQLRFNSSQNAVAGVAETTEIDVHLEAASSNRTRFSLRIGSGNSEISATDITPTVQLWTLAAERLENLARTVASRKGRLRQAVIVIHGIGEQEPGDTLRSLVEGVLEPLPAERLDEEFQAWWKPDRSSRLFEMRMVTLKGQGRRQLPTDVYELYWAHLIRDTSLGHVYSWLRQLMLRRDVPSQFRMSWYALWGTLLAAVSLLVVRLGGWASPITGWLAGGGLVTTIAVMFWRASGRSVLLQVVGDASRYLSARPENIGHRQRIREEGVALLDRLHNSGRYDRIVVLGHSLGSVVGYDIITRFWAENRHKHAHLDRVDNQAAIAVNKALSDSAAISSAEAQRLQLGAWLAARANGFPWLISDFVTIGSPLSMADFLLASSKEDFERGVEERRFPTCPPQAETNSVGHSLATYTVAFTDRSGKPDRTIELFHDGAPFALTRWTNLYFPVRLLGDPIGGPVGGWAGAWVNDVALARPGKRRFGLHSRYWTPDSGNAHIQALREALKLRIAKTLRKSVRKHSPLLYLPADGDR